MERRCTGERAVPIRKRILGYCEECIVQGATRNFLPQKSIRLLWNESEPLRKPLLCFVVTSILNFVVACVICEVDIVERRADHNVRILQ